MKQMLLNTHICSGYWVFSKIDDKRGRNRFSISAPFVFYYNS